jgi:hypothetical protein
MMPLGCAISAVITATVTAIPAVCAAAPVSLRDDFEGIDGLHVVPVSVADEATA